MSCIDILKYILQSAISNIYRWQYMASQWGKSTAIKVGVCCGGPESVAAGKVEERQNAEKSQYSISNPCSQLDPVLKDINRGGFWNLLDFKAFFPHKSKHVQFKSSDWRNPVRHFFDFQEPKMKNFQEPKMINFQEPKMNVSFPPPAPSSGWNRRQNRWDKDKDKNKDKERKKLIWSWSLDSSDQYWSVMWSVVVFFTSSEDCQPRSRCRNCGNNISSNLFFNIPF